MPAGLDLARGDIAMTLTAQGAATVTGGPVANSGAAGVVVLMVHVSAVGGTPTLDVSLEESNDGSSWTALAGSSITQLTAVGNRLATAVPAKALVRPTATVAGTTPSVTAKVSILVFSD